MKINPFQKNTPNEMIFTFLIMPRKEGGFLGMCRETGEIRHGETIDEAQKRLINSTIAIVDTVIKNPQYLPSLSVGLSFNNKVLFYSVLARRIFLSLKKNVGDFEFFTRSGATLSLHHG